MTPADVTAIRQVRVTEGTDADYLIEVELPCINGLKAWFLLATVWATDFAALQMTDGAFPAAKDTAEAIAGALHAGPHPQPGRET